MWRAGRRAPILCCTPRPWAPQPPRPQVETLPGEHATAFLHSGAAGGRRARRLRALGMIFAEDRTCHDASCGREIVYALPLSSCLFFSLLPPPLPCPHPPRRPRGGAATGFGCLAVRSLILRRRRRRHASWQAGAVMHRRVWRRRAHIREMKTAPLTLHTAPRLAEARAPLDTQRAQSVQRATAQRPWPTSAAAGLRPPAATKRPPPCSSLH